MSLSLIMMTRMKVDVRYMAWSQDEFSPPIDDNTNMIHPPTTEPTKPRHSPTLPSSAPRIMTRELEAYMILRSLKETSIADHDERSYRMAATIRVEGIYRGHVT